jgi:hypothetical protein
VVGQQALVLPKVLLLIGATMDRIWCTQTYTHQSSGAAMLGLCCMLSIVCASDREYGHFWPQASMQLALCDRAAQHAEARRSAQAWGYCALLVEELYLEHSISI